MPEPLFAFEDVVLEAEGRRILDGVTARADVGGRALPG
jgi:hypothetical protein